MTSPTVDIEAIDDALSAGLGDLSSGLEACGALLEDYAAEHDKGDDLSVFHFQLAGLLKLFGSVATRLDDLHGSIRLRKWSRDERPSRPEKQAQHAEKKPSKQRATKQEARLARRKGGAA
jgi:hypothetical protein